MNMLPPGQTMQDALVSANVILSKLDAWKAEAEHKSQRDQSRLTGEAVMREHIADVIAAAVDARLAKWRDVIRGAVESICWGGVEMPIKELEKLLGES